MVKALFTLVVWLVHLFDPPPLASLSVTQKIGRALFVSLSLMTICISTALVGAAGLYGFQRGDEIVSTFPNLLNGLAIVSTGIVVNVLCVMVLLEIRKLDLKPGQGVVDHLA
jgi:uncharacterized membrane protein YidH (DUF202 family)